MQERIYEELERLVDRYASLHLHDNAIFYAERLLQERPSEETRIRLALCYVAAGRTAQALDKLEGCVSPSGRYLFARYLVESGRYSDAESVLYPYLGPASPAQHAAALQAYEAVAAAERTRANASALSGVQFGHLVGLDVSRVPQGAASLWVLGSAALRGGRPEQARAYFRLAVALDPLLWDAYAAMCSATLGEPSEAERTYGSAQFDALGGALGRQWHCNPILQTLPTPAEVYPLPQPGDIGAAASTQSVNGGADGRGGSGSNNTPAAAAAPTAAATPLKPLDHITGSLHALALVTYHSARLDVSAATAAYHAAGAEAAAAASGAAASDWAADTNNNSSSMHQATAADGTTPHATPAPLLLLMPPSASAVANLRLGRAHLDVGDYRTALRFLRRARTLDPGAAEGLDLHSTALWHCGDQVALTALADEAASRGALAHWQGWCVQGNMFSLKKEHKTALTCFLKAISISPSCSAAHALAGHEHIAIGDVAAATACFQRAVAFDKRAYSAWFGLGVASLRQSDTVAAEGHFRRAVAVNPHSSVLRCYLGLALGARGRTAQADAELARAVALEPPSSGNALQPRYQRAVLFESMGTPDGLVRAYAELQTLRTLSPKEPALLLHLARIAGQLIEQDRAAGAVARAEERTRAATGYLTEALALARTDKEANAVRMLLAGVMA
jgi:anaphase-promoting complex subunit 3